MHPARGVRRLLAQPDVQDFAGVRARGDQRVVATHLRGAEGGALLVRTEHLADDESTSTTSHPSPGPAAAAQALASVSASTRSSWRTGPKGSVRRSYVKSGVPAGVLQWIM